MATYWHRHPRGFWNECDLYKAEDAAEAAWMADHDYERITRRDAERHERNITEANYKGFQPWRPWMYGKFEPMPASEMIIDRAWVNAANDENERRMYAAMALRADHEA